MEDGESTIITNSGAAPMAALWLKQVRDDMRGTTVGAIN